MIAPPSVHPTGPEARLASPAPPLDPAALRRDFPILGREVHGCPLVYLDSAATSQKPAAVIEAVDDYYRRHNANVHRGVHCLAEEATDLYERARIEIARFVGAEDARELVFTRGTTEAINLVAGSWGAANLGPGDTVVLTEMEHHANIVPWQLLAERTGAALRFIPITDEGTLDLDWVDNGVDASVKLVAFTHTSNVLGTSNPVDRLVAAARAVGAKVLLDAAQAVPHQPVDVRALGVDFLVFSGHKMCGPTGIGCLWARYELLESMPPWQGGGEMIRRVTLDGSTYADPPSRFEAGTPPIAGALGLAEAARYLTGIGLDRIHAHTGMLAERAIAALTQIPGVTVYGPREAHGSAVAFTLEGVHPHDLATVLDRQGIAVRAGHHCAMPLHSRLGLAASARASFYLYNTVDEVEALAAGVGLAREMFGLA